MIGETDSAIRLAAFRWLTRQRDEHGEALPRTLLEGGFELDGRRVPMLGPSGIWKPAICELPISITTVLGGRYSDSMGTDGLVLYAYRGTDPNHRDNRGLRQTMRERDPLVYFHPIVPGRYVAAYPVFIVDDDPRGLFFTAQVDDLTAALSEADLSATREDAEPRRAYVTATFRRRVHQAAFRERVVRAYQQQCALCRLRHSELLDAAHITPDRDAEGDPVVSNGLALCKLHHAAFDGFFFAVRPDYVIEVRPSILAETDGPMLIVGLQQIHGQRIHLPSRHVDLPDRDRLARRYEDFRLAS